MIDKTIAVMGLGYVGLPLAVEFGKSRPVIGFDINAGRIDALLAGHDATQEVSRDEFATADQLTFSNNPADLAAASIYIVTVPPQRWSSGTTSSLDMVFPRCSLQQIRVRREVQFLGITSQIQSVTAS